MPYRFDIFVQLPHLLTMASVNFLYRSAKDKGFLNLRLLHRVVGDEFPKGHKDFVVGGKTKLQVTKHYWEKEHSQKRPKDIQVSNRQTEVKKELNNIENHILNAFNSSDPLAIDKKWLQDQMEAYYNPSKDDDSRTPNGLIDYIEFYIDGQKNHVSEGTIKKSNVIKQMMIKFQDSKDHRLLIKDINLDFKRDFESFLLQKGYAYNTISRALKFAKTVARHAYSQGIETSRQLNSIKTKTKESERIHLSFEELEKIKKKEFKEEHLQIAKDWLLISCFTGQRISDFMRFNKGMIRQKGDKYLLEFKQKKTGKDMTIPLLKQVKEVLAQRAGDFPRVLPDQKYNNYIKTVCSRAGLKDMVWGSKKVEVSKGEYRKQAKYYEKWELVTSHIGRRSFATNYHGKVPLTHLMTITGHHTERNLIAYLGKGDEEKAMDAFKYFE